MCISNPACGGNYNAQADKCRKNGDAEAVQTEVYMWCAPAWPLRMALSWEPRSGADMAGAAAAAAAGGDGSNAREAAGGDGAAAGPLAGAGARASSAANAGASTLHATRCVSGLTKRYRVWSGHERGFP